MTVEYAYYCSYGHTVLRCYKHGVVVGCKKAGFAVPMKRFDLCMLCIVDLSLSALVD